MSEWFCPFPVFLLKEGKNQKLKWEITYQHYQHHSTLRSTLDGESDLAEQGNISSSNSTNSRPSGNS
jgi:hypothetical protein